MGSSRRKNDGVDSVTVTTAKSSKWNIRVSREDGANAGHGGEQKECGSVQTR